MSRKKSKILFIGEAVTLAHVARPLVLAKLLSAEEYEVHLAFDSRFDRVVQPSLKKEDATHIQRQVIKSPNTQSFRDQIEKGQFPYKADDVMDLVKEDLKLFHQVQPDLVIGDFRISLALSARLEQIPYLSLTNGCWLLGRQSQSPYPIPDIGIYPRLPKTLVRFFQERVFRHAAQPFAQAGQKLGLGSVSSDLREVYTDGDRILLADPPEWSLLEKTAQHNFSSKVRIIGPLYWEPQVPQPIWWSDFCREKRKIIYINLGSSGPALDWQSLSQSLIHRGYAVVVSTFHQSFHLPNVEQGLYQGEFLPSQEILKKSSVFVGNGGSMSSFMALAYGCPIVALPANYDQQLTMDPICQMGVGQVLYKKNQKIKNVLRCVEMFLEENKHVKDQLERTKRIFAPSTLQKKIFVETVHELLAGQPKVG